MRRLSTLVVLLGVVALSWLMIGDPADGVTLISVGNARVLYTSSALALGGAGLGGMLFSLAGFFLVRGRIAEDLRSGTGGVIAATPVGNAGFLLSRWLGGVAYLGALVLAFLGALLVCHALRGDGPIQPGVYLATFLLVLLPTVLFAVSCAVLFDAWAPLMGKRGDVLYFLLWMAQLALASQLAGAVHGEVPGGFVFDFPGIATAGVLFQATLHTDQLMLGGASFDPHVAPVTLPAQLWTGSAVLVRAVCAALALLPLLPAAGLFHRFSPDRARPAHARRRRSPLALLNAWLRPLARLAQPLFRLAALLPGTAGQVLADVALTLTMAPAAIAALLGFWLVSLCAAPASLGGVLAAAVAVWGVLVSELGARDAQAGALELTGAVRGGLQRRDLRLTAATFVLGLLFTGVIALRWAPLSPVRACAVVSGVFALSAVATLLGRLTETSRAFLALFLFGLYVALNATRVPALDVVGFNGVAHAGTVLGVLVTGLAALAGATAWSQRRWA
ncbi:hypothetical protein FGE12_21880 [Aggregicoccus sp. 17bor-14]|nr:hypothetical protein [Simulacricoccus sp. 17bor-14]MRI90809.1 hypothetical protein [Aggregicoccus sp. 17bor-14]